MSTPSRIDRESFQMLLANAFAVQESGMDTQSLSTILELQRSIATGEPEVDRTMHQVADLARNVANATGTAIALLRGDQLVYRAGSGCAATYVGRHVTAVLSASAHNQARGEILRVENARTDARIEAAICRERGANSLLILPIHRERAVAGVLEVLFDEAHAYQDRELRTYRLMAGLVEEAMFRNAQLDRKRPLAAHPTTVPHAIELISQMQKFRGDGKSAPRPAPNQGIGQVGGAATAVAGELSGARPPAKAAATITLLLERASLDKFRWSVAAAGVVAALVIASWIAYDHRPASPVDASALQRSNAARQQVTSVPAEASPVNHISKPQTAAGGTQDMKAASSAFKRVQVGQNEVDYIAEDVTIRHFRPPPAPTRIPVGKKQVDFGEDVTVRYFASKPTDVSQIQPVPTATQSVQRSLPVSK